jgi:hypothetical protein
MKKQCKISKCKTLQELKRTKCNNECMTIYACQFCEHKKKGGKATVTEMLNIDCNNCLNQSVFRQEKHHFTACGY